MTNARGLRGTRNRGHQSAVPVSEPVVPPEPPAIDLQTVADGLDDRAYCLAYPDVAVAIAAGQVSSVDNHYWEFGRAEVESGRRRSPHLDPAKPHVAIPVIIALLGYATEHNQCPWSFLSQNERDLVQDFANELFEAVYVESYADVRSALETGVSPSGFAHWLNVGRREIIEGLRAVDAVYPRRPYAYDTGGPNRLKFLLGAVKNWGSLLDDCAKGLDFRLTSLQFDGAAAPATTALRALAYARVLPNDLAIHTQLQSGAEQIWGFDPKIVAFYLPQYHAIPENDQWWGAGFTEWTNVRKAKPNFQGHQQPRVPLNQDYYDLSDPNVQRRQAALAKEYGVSAFCYYMYWFDGRRVLERPLDQMVADQDIDHEFCICWANENWTRNWDGKSEDILLSQVHTPESDRRFILDAIQYLADPRYLRVAGKLALLVYRVDLLPDCRSTAAIWRDEIRRAGLGELHLCAVQFYGITDPEPWGFDAAVEFPPHGWLVQENAPSEPLIVTNPDFAGTIFDYDKSVSWALSKPYPDYTWYRGAFPGWDNTARRQHTPHIFASSNPFSFQTWMTSILRQTAIMAPVEHQIVFVNAWNEWGEGAHLEPDDANGMLNLMALNSALNTAKREAWPLAVLTRLRRTGDYMGRSNDERALLNLLRGSENALGILVTQLRATGLNPFI